MDLIKIATSKNKTAANEFNFFDDKNRQEAGNISRRDDWKYGTNISYAKNIAKNQRSKDDQWKKLRNLNPLSTTTIHVPTDGYFCDSPNSEYAHFVLERFNGNSTNSLFDLDALLAMCDLESELINISKYSSLCQMEVGSKDCCRPWSIPNYVALLSNKSSCSELQEDDASNIKDLLMSCYRYYHNFKLSNDCKNTRCETPLECTQHNAVYNILHFLVDNKVNDSNVFATNAERGEECPFLI